jgi:hypothetical protein
MEMHRTMALVSVPDGVVASGKPTEASSTDAKILQDTLHYRYMYPSHCHLATHIIPTHNPTC